jgi:hypothetical protein
VGAGGREGPCGLKGRLLIEAAGILGPLWLHWRRLFYRRRSRPLDVSERAQLAGFHEPAVLDAVRVSIVPKIADPWAFRGLRWLGITTPSSLETMAGMAVIDTIVIAANHRLVRRRDDHLPLIFHELVHIVQYRLLGVRGMVRRYVRGWAGCGYDYWSIPLEEDAYELTERFVERPRSVFSVEHEVRRRLTGAD